MFLFDYVLDEILGQFQVGEYVGFEQCVYQFQWDFCVGFGFGVVGVVQQYVDILFLGVFVIGGDGDVEGFYLQWDVMLFGFFVQVGGLFGVVYVGDCLMVVGGQV